MNELVKVVELNGKQAVNARDLHKALDVGRDFSNWIKGRIDEYGFVEDEDFFVLGRGFSPQSGENLPENQDEFADAGQRVFAKSGENLPENQGRKSSLGGRPKTEYLLSVGVAKELAMVENNEKGRYVRRYLIRVEEIFRAAIAGMNLVHNAVFEKLVDVIERQESLVETLMLGAAPRISKEQTARFFIQTHLVKTGLSDDFLSRTDAHNCYKLYAARIEGLKTLNLNDFTRLVKILCDVPFSEKKENDWGWYGLKFLR
jgi:phage anti-repressor protein